MPTKIQVRDNSYMDSSGKAGEAVKQIELFIGGLWFRCSVVSERDIKLATRIASENGLTLYRCDEEQAGQISL